MSIVLLNALLFKLKKRTVPKSNDEWDTGWYSEITPTNNKLRIRCRSLNVRTGPGVEYKACGTLPKRRSCYYRQNTEWLG